MSKRKTRPNQSVRLKERVEDFLNSNLAAIKKIPPADIRNLFEDLQIYQTDLENHSREMQESEYRFRKFLNDLGDIAYEADSSGNITYANKMSETITGVPLKDIIGKPFLPLFDKKNQEIAIDVYQRTLNGENPEYDLTFTNGKICRFKNRPLHDKENKIIGVFGIARDITEQKLAEKKYRLLADNVTDAIFVVNIDKFGFEYVSPSVKFVFGYTVEEFGNLNVYDFLIRDSADHAMKILAREIEKDNYGKAEPQLIDLEVVRKDGLNIWIGLSARFLRDNEGHVTSVLCVARDISERKKAGAVLKGSEEKYRFLAENVSDMIWIMDMNFNYTYVSPSITRMLGFTVEEGLARTVEESVTPASFNNAMKVLAEELELNTKGRAPIDRSIKIENELLCKDGSTVLTEAEVSFIYDSKGQPEGIIGATRDITERKDAEKRQQFQRDLAMALSKTRTLEETLEEVLAKIFQLDEFDSGGVYLFDEKTNGLSLLVHQGLPQMFVDKVKYYNPDDIRIQLIMKGDPIYQTASKLPEFIKNDLKMIGILTLAVIPIKHGDNIIGAINLASHTHDVITDYSMGILKSISEVEVGVPISRVIAEEALNKAKDELEEKVKERTSEIQEKSIALKVLLKQRENDKKKLEGAIMSNVRELLIPNINRLKSSTLSSKQQTALSVLESNLNEIISPFVSSKFSIFMKLTPTEIQVANFIKYGMSSKDIAESLCLSQRTVDTHRYNIRKKLEVSGKGINLRTYLLSMA